MSDHNHERFLESEKEAQEEFDLDKRIEDVYALSPFEYERQIKQLLRDFSKYVTPERYKYAGEDPSLAPYNSAIDHLEANTRKVLGDE